MPTKEIKELRQAGKLEEAYAMAKAEFDADSTNIWGKRNLSWVLYAQLDEFSSNLDAFIEKINEVKQLDLPESEEMFFENISIVISKATRAITNESSLNINNIYRLFDSIKDLPIKRNCKWFTALFNAMHKGMKETYRYIEFADWWDFKNFRPEDYQKEKLPNGKEVMAIAEQAYIAYAKHLLPKQTQSGEKIFNKEKAEAFLPVLSQIVEDYPQFQYPAYFNAKLLLALGDNENMLESLLPFAKKKSNNFWVWDILSEAFSNNEEIVFACYCKALSCKSPEEMLVNLRQKMASLLISRKLYDEAKTEIELLIHARNIKGYKIPAVVNNWINSDWFKNANSIASNLNLYQKYLPIAEAQLYSDVIEENVIVEFINKDKKILNFIASEIKYGFFKYDRFLKQVEIGDILKVRFKDGKNEGLFQLYSAFHTVDKEFSNIFLKDVKGVVKINDGKNFGFIDNVFIHPSIVSKHKLFNGTEYSGRAIKTYNKEKKQWSWKLL